MHRSCKSNWVGYATSTPSPPSTTRYQHSRTPFLLMSSLNMEEKFMWSGARKQAFNSTAQKALEFLTKEQDFWKLDSLLEEKHAKDQVLFAVWDLIIATRALNFATCTKGCGGICTKCNHLGNFASLAAELRNHLHKDSQTCWPS